MCTWLHCEYTFHTVPVLAEVTFGTSETCSIFRKPNKMDAWTTNWHLQHQTKINENSVLIRQKLLCAWITEEKTTGLDVHETWWKGVTWAKEEPIKIWSGSKSWGGHTNYFSLLLTLRVKVQVLQGWTLRDSTYRHLNITVQMKHLGRGLHISNSLLVSIWISFENISNYIFSQVIRFRQATEKRWPSTVSHVASKNNELFTDP